MFVTSILSICNQYVLFITSTPNLCYINKKGHANPLKGLNLKQFLTVS